jgi:FKBP-type peptidyl-prolyl cis-trans isomerase
MKRALLICWLLPAAAGLYAGAIREDVQKADEKARISYAFGMVIGFDLADTGVELDYAAFAEGLKSMLENTDRPFSEDEAMEIAQDALRRAMEKKAAENRQMEARFLTENGARPEITTTPSGLQYEALVEGGGEKPGPDDIVRVHYEGALINGTVFDSSYERNETAEFPVEGVIPGWAEGIQLMAAGSKYRFYIPSELAYGEEGIRPVIPPSSTLIFTVELLEIIDPAME